MSSSSTVSSVSKGKKRSRRSPPDGFPSPEQFRLSIQSLVADNQMQEANTLSEQGLAAYPRNEGVLAITALLAVVREDWSKAILLLEQLMDIQGDSATDFTRDMYARALRCAGKVNPESRQSIAATSVL